MTWWIPSAWAVEYTVGRGGDFSDLPAAAATVVDGDVLVLLDAVSGGDVVFTADVTLRGGGAARTRVIARGAPYVLGVVGSHRLTLDSLTVDGLGVAGLVHVGGGLDAVDVGFVNAAGPAGLLLEGDKSSSLVGCGLVDNGAAVTVEATTTEPLLVDRSTFAYGSGGVDLRVDRAGRLELHDTVFTDNRGAAVVVTDTPVTLRDVSFFRPQDAVFGLEVSAPLEQVDLGGVRCEAWAECAFVDASTLLVDGLWAERGSLALGGIDGCALTDVSVVSGDLTARCGRGGTFDRSFLCDGAFGFDGAMAVSDVLVANSLDGLVLADPGPITITRSAFLECDSDLSLPEPGPDVPGTSNNFWPDLRLDDPFTRYKASADVAEDSWGGVTACAELPVVSGVVGMGGGMGGADADGDGWCAGRICADPRLSPFDCDDADGSRHPLADELVADGLDGNCDGLERCWVDADGDGFGGDTRRDGDRMCLHAGLSSADGDCDDASAGSHPGAPDAPADGVDSDCDGLELCYRDVDGDGFRTTTFGAPNDGDCTDAGEAVGSQGVDCDDTRAAVNPAAAEVCDAADRDEDCDGLSDDADTAVAGRIFWYRDLDGDTFGAGESALRCDASPTHTVTTAGDCAPADPATHPGAAEIVGDPIDNDCDGAATCYVDGDDDGDRTAASTPGNGDADCADASEALATDPADCDDADPSRHHGATEAVGDSVDQDCDGRELCFTDSDGDGYGFSTPMLISVDPDCFDAGEAATSDDCAPGNADVHPGATELPADLVDQDCDGLEWCFVDGDGDAHGTTTTVVSPNLSCANAGEAWVDDDCDDTRTDRFPGNPEVPANGVDEDCDGFDSVLDTDGDGYDNTVDCDDTDPAVHPDATELPGDLVDQDCDGDELCWLDADGDGHGDPAVELPSPDLDCTTAPEAATGDDCDDADAARAPSLPELCDASDVDEDCDGLSDDADASAAGLAAWFPDVDGDGFGGAGGGLACDPPPGATPGGGDCDDLDGSVFPGATEAPGDGVDGDCDGAEACFADADGDGARTATASPGSLGCDVGDEALAALPVDCDDADPGRAPGALEVVADGVDQDCDLSEVCWLDADDDGVGAATTTPSPDDACDGAALAWLTGDCDDADPGRYPGLLEVPADGVDQNCDGSDGDVDLDGDGALASVDCDDTDATVFPGAPEGVGDLVDQDCDGADLCHEDTDLDGFGSAALVPGAPTCASAGVAAAGGDCDDADGGVSPGAGERPADGVDQDCDGVEVCFVDADGDGFGDAVTGLGPLSCAGFSTVATDCDDGVATTFPGAVEACDGADTDCVGGLPAAEADRDGDRFVGCQPAGWVATPRPIGGGDCDDLDRAVHPGVFDEVPGDGVDQDCDGFESCLEDSDGDGFGGTVTSVPLGTACADVGAGDCDDADGGVFPGAAERPFDGVDQDCDGDPGCARDADGDGVGGDDVVSCRHPDAVTLGDDCDDDDAARWPGAVEVCDGLDDDCDGVADDGLPVGTWYVDGDGDGVGAGVGFVGCGGGAGYAGVGGDCDDLDPARHPGAQEACDQDLDCDGRVFECTGADDDGDGWCADVSCAGDLSPGDCDDDDPAVNPGATEDCDNGVDDDCDGRRDFRGDADGDGVDACLDCDDLDQGVFPGAFEVCDEVDGDCDGAVDEGLSADQDGDGWNDAASCELPGGLADCDDRDAAIHPFAEERFGDAVDQDCDTFPGAPPPEVDADGDGFCAGGGHDDEGDGRCDGAADGPGDPDCDDFALQDHPGAPELADGVDNDCDGVVDDLDPADADGDGVLNDVDCDDHDLTVFPGAEERCNGVDDACDGGLEAEVDLDFDGFRACEDCDDRDATVFPGAEEDCGNGVDDNCDGTADDRVDRDGDGRSECEGDCAPQDPTIPAAVEACNGLDDDCNGAVDEGFDVDGDGVTACPGCVVGDPGCDCDDLAARVHPGAIEVCFNVVDENCDGSLEDTNADGDPFTACGGDCDDGDPTVFPGAHESCDGRDQDCDAVADDGYDVDQDGVLGCAGDCDDDDAGVNAFAAEVCGDGTDQDCDQVDLDCPPACAAVETCGDGTDDDCDGLGDADDPDCATAPEPHTGLHSAAPVGRGAPDARCGCGHAGGGWAPGLLALGLLRRRRAPVAAGTTP